MKLFIRNKEETFHVDVAETDTIKTLKEKISERYTGQFYQLAFAGKVLDKGSLQKFGIGNEATIHLLPEKPITFVVDWKGDCRKVTIPSKSVSVRDVKREIRNVFPDEDSFAHKLPKLKKDGKVLDNSKTVAQCGLSEGDTLVAEETTSVAQAKDATLIPADSRNDEEKKDDLLNSFDTV